MSIFKINNIDNIKISNSKDLLDGTLCSDSVYFVNGKENIIISYSLRNNSVNCIKTSNIFDKITYDPDESCFWTYSKSLKNKLFKFNEHINEINHLNIPNTFNKTLTTLNYNNSINCLTLDLSGKSFNLNKYSILTRVLPYNVNFNYNSIYTYEDYFFCIYNDSFSNILEVFYSNNKIAIFKLPLMINLKSIIHINKTNSLFNILLLIDDLKESSYIAHCSLKLQKSKEKKQCTKINLKNFTYKCYSLI